MNVPILSEFVKGLSEAEFRSDVQLSSYHRLENEDLVKSYIFTSKATEGKKSSAELLRLLAEAYMPGKVPNRFTFIANYGHGKSHFALMLANYFGRLSDSPEIKAILDKLDHALDDRAEFGFFRSLKSEDRNPFLVLTLRGDEPGDLRSKFFRALDVARQQYPELASIPLPFWFAGAESFLASIPQGFYAEAEKFLESRNLDLALLSEQVRRRESGTQLICRDLFNHLYGADPNFGEHASIRDAIAWAADNLCGFGKPVEKLLVIFDEFGAFVRDYSHGETRGPGTPLQDLLNGVENQRGRAAFVALTQQDPDAIARSVLTNGTQGGDAESLLKELNRLPDSERFILHSSLELVLDAYLKQSPNVWDELMNKPEFSRAVREATEVAFGAFKQRYHENLGWDFSQFREVMTEGCFPLHPLTTVLLSTLQLRSTAAAPRTVLGFVIRVMEDRSGEPVIRDGKPNWVWPTALADYFKDGLDEKPYGDFLDAMQQAGGANAPAEHSIVLKAMLLQIAGDVETRQTGYETTVAQLCGLPKQDISQALRELSDAGIIRHDADGRFYTFWPAGRGAHKVEELLQKKLRDTVLDRRVLDKVGDLLNKNGQMQPVTANVQWGHPDDWHAAQAIIGYPDFEQSTLLKLSAERLQWRLDGTQRPRALVAWLLAENEEHADDYRKNGASVLDQAFGDSYAPVIAMRSRIPRPEFARLMLELYGLSLFGDMDIKDVGQEQYEDRRRRTMSRLSDVFSEFRKTVEYEVPKLLRARVKIVPQRLDSVLAEVLKTAYYQGPKEFYRQFKLNQPKLKNSVTNVYGHLSDNTIDSPTAFRNDPVARQIVDLFLRDKWSVTNASLRLKEPAHGSPVYSGWKALDDYFEAGAASASVRTILSELLNPPYGYDHNTLTLLFTAWYGYNRHDIQLSSEGRLTTLGEVAKDHKKGLKQPKEFLTELNNCTIVRRNRSELTRDVEDLIQKVERDTFSKSEASDGIRKLQNFLEDDRSDPNLRIEVESAANSLEQAIEAAAEYDHKAGSLRGRADKKRKVSELVTLMLDIGKLPRTSRVRPSEPSPEALRNLLRGRVESVTEAHCAEHERINDVTEYGLCYQELQDERKVLSKVGLAVLVERVDRALQTLKECKESLERGQKDEAALATLRTIPSKGSLSDLRRYRQSVADLVFQGAEARQESQLKADTIQSAISRLEGFAQGLAERLSSLTQRVRVQILKEEIVRHQDLFDGSSEQRDVEQALDRCKALECYFTDLSEATNILPKTPDEVEEQLRNLGHLETKYAETLGPAQLDVLNKAEKDMRQEAARRKEQALSWLDSLEQDLDQLSNSGQSDGEKVEKLLGRVEAPPPFLPLESRERLDGCEQGIRQFVDRDQTLQVELHFKRITTRSKQEECLERLRHLLQES